MRRPPGARIGAGALFACLSLALGSCSLPATDPERRGEWDVFVDDPGDGGRGPAVMTMEGEGSPVTVASMARIARSGGAADSIDLRLKDEWGVELEVPLAGLPADDRWILLRISRAREYVAARLVEWIWGESGRWSPRLALVALSLNGSAPGPWLLAETVGRGDLRVPLKKLEPDDGDAWRVQGGYLYEYAPPSRIDADGSEFPTLTRFTGKYKTPDRPTLRQAYYLEAWHNGFEAACARSPASVINAAIEDYADIPAFLDWILIGELSGLEPFGDFEVILSKDRGGKLAPCPWSDSRAAFPRFESGEAPAMNEIPFVGGILLEPGNMAALRERWAALRALSLGDAAVRERIRALFDEYLDRFPEADAEEAVAALELGVFERIRALDRW